LYDRLCSSIRSLGDNEQVFNAYGWYKANSYDAGIENAHEVGLKNPNHWGLYDMHGNIWEWTEDWYYGSYRAEHRPNPTERVVRGGGYDYEAEGARSAFRYHYSPRRSAHVIGFRLVKESL
jgi:formylglycine-generating enzyme required for sulfatase activity